MLLNGKEIRVLVGAITVFQDIPLSITTKRKLSKTDDAFLEKLFDKIMTITEKEYKKINAEKYIDKETVEKRICISLNYTFSYLEMLLIIESLEAYIAEAKARNDGKSLNVYHGGDPYDLDTIDFVKFLNRLQKAQPGKSSNDII